MRGLSTISNFEHRIREVGKITVIICKGALTSIPKDIPHVLMKKETASKLITELSKVKSKIVVFTDNNTLYIPYLNVIIITNIDFEHDFAKINPYRESENGSENQ